MSCINNPLISLQRGERRQERGDEGAEEAEEAAELIRTNALFSKGERGRRRVKAPTAGGLRSSGGLEEVEEVEEEEEEVYR
ncbi:hypothetical protein EYF80_065788 [Liparis tanakae]|uniref:Uncharacterized protein n=1 Tax=Liparis tanakae TaxID=230148 RepID=A0A4Z2E5Q0_9TELE|nr:hypothetical protein EYF80_065788 [Liparis tanakae]